jgi:hypothetical protein
MASAAPLPEQAYALLLDLNGTLIYRSDSELKQVPGGVHVRGRWLYARPGAVALLEKLASRFTLLVCTSMVLHNALSCLEVISPDWQRWIRKVLDRPYNRPDPNGGHEWDTVRDVKRILADSELTFLRLENFIFVDNESRKCVDAPTNCLIVPELGVAELVQRNDSSTQQISQYLCSLADAKPSDVRVYLQAHQLLPARIPVAVATGAAAADAHSELETKVAALSLESRAAKVAEMLHPDRVLDVSLSFHHAEANELSFLDVGHAFRAVVMLPLPAGARIEYRIALARLLEIDGLRVRFERGKRVVH